MLAGATLMLCLGQSVGVLVAARVLQGFSATVVWVVGLTLLVDTVGPDQVGAAMGTAMLGTSLSFLVGPLLGGVVYEQAGYYV
jgi:predicted MFS family arabinose efflux permease